MTFNIIVAGKASHAYAQKGIEEYLKRLQRYGKFKLHYVKNGDAPAVSERLLKLAENSLIVALDERGEDFTSQEFAHSLRDWTDDPTIKAVSFLIGGADGHTAELRKASRKIIRLSKMTMMHELALVVFLEQLYRGCTINKGEPYHR